MLADLRLRDESRGSAGYRRTMQVLARGWSVVVVAVAGCGPDTEPALTLDLDGQSVAYVAETEAGEPLGLSFDPEVTEVYSQQWTTTELDGPRSAVRMGYGSFVEAAVPVAAISNDVMRFYDADGTEIGAGDFRVDDLIATGRAEQPVLYSGPFSATVSGTASFGPWCGEGEEHSNTGCGFPVPDGVTEAEIAWPGLELTPDTDGCSNAAWTDQLQAGTWTWAGDTLTLANGQPFDCVRTPLDELVCTSTWTHESAYGSLWYSETTCPFEVTAVIWPDVAGTASVPYQTHAYWHVRALDKFTFDIAEQCLGAEAACIAYR